MAKFVGKFGDFRVYALDQREARDHNREFPCWVCWFDQYPEDVGNMDATEKEDSSILEMIGWCLKNS